MPGKTLSLSEPKPQAGKASKSRNSSRRAPMHAVSERRTERRGSAAHAPFEVRRLMLEY